ncbi:hypothetical protein SAMN04489835_3049 [Mycolicibacterium rutilum]|uniref:Alanine and proline rich membrane protein n=1 Tax=Mycolicibacterium rutilum TaxID=370526 RepID=A0A1H6K5G6_MYCRU|nr:hypothetical protein [Mycolicibacterium rutilum]SEH70288.1 hypothetical protein SAMN04489835_3049 [Mycolicibacterium rutilum]
MKYLIGGVAAALVIAGVVVVLLTRGDGDLSPDCQKAEHALRPLAGAMGEVISTLPADVTDEPLDRPAAAAAEAEDAAEIRTRAAAIESAALRAEVNTVADALEAISRSTLAPASAAPSREYFGAKTRLDNAIQAIVKACPGIGDEPPVRP